MKKLLAAILLMLSSAGTSGAQSGPSIKIGVLNDQSSSFSALGGTEVVNAVRLAISDFGGKALGKPIELVSADHQNKPEVALTIARQWIERESVDVIADIASSAVALGVNTLLGKEKKIGLFVSPLTDRMTEADCNGYGIAWAYDSYSVVRSSVKAQIAGGGKSWFVLSPDYEAGKVLESSVKRAVEDEGGTVVGAIRAPLGTTDFSSYILQAQGSGADAIFLNFNGPELVNALKQIQEFGIVSAGQKIAIAYLHLSDARAIGAETLRSVRFASPWYWNMDEASRSFGLKMMKITGNAPNWVAAGTYSAVTAYLKAVEKAGTDDTDTIIKEMRETKIDDFFVHNSKLYPNGRLIHDMYMLEVKAPDQIKEKDDFFKLVSTVPAVEAFRPLEQSACKIGK